ncbi:tetratricopeptide repeat protein [Nostoc sp. FACHB-110]|uniref:tetratricopeptide repeat protein n=1 Tax=Nostoc sp. FACHB-110 TaxID=2692834 RepID=UPI0016886F83|nr:tetratricopeptide repeat protein [Nostoc sp. FACHB-110]MBD2436790.1 tetratricopeptide repeat protein [Nostoc sp. FACHB-110]
MNQTLLSTTALITITWFTPLGAIKPASAQLTHRESLNQVVAPNSNSHQIDLGRQLSGMLVIAGAGVFGWFAMRNGKRLLFQNNLDQNTANAALPTIEKSPKEQPIYITETTDIPTYIKRAYSHFKQGDTQKAIEEFNKAIGFNPHNAYLYGERANFRRKNLGDKQGAIEDYSKAIGIHPQNALFYLWRSQAYNDMGEQRKAIEDYNTAIRLAPENTMYHDFYGAVNSRE